MYKTIEVSNATRCRFEATAFNGSRTTFEHLDNVSEVYDWLDKVEERGFCQAKVTGIMVDAGTG